MAAASHGAPWGTLIRIKADAWRLSDIRRMQTRFVFSTAATLLASLAFLPACRRAAADVPVDASSRSFEVTGVGGAAVSEGQVVIEHETISGFMPAMTMPFLVAEPATSGAARLIAGDRVRFRFVVGASSHADRFEIVGHETPAPQKTADNGAAVTRRPPRLREGGTVPDFTLVDQDGRRLTRADLDRQLTVLTFIFTRCPVPEFCPAMSQRFAFLQREILEDEKLRARTRLLSVTLDPEFDRPEVLRAYGEAMGANFATWRFATGEPAEAKALAKAFAIFSEFNGTTIDHTLCTALIGPDDRVIELWRGNGWKTAEVLAALRSAAATADNPSSLENVAGPGEAPQASSDAASVVTTTNE
jgi:protein SCO1/2